MTTDINATELVLNGVKYIRSDSIPNIPKDITPFSLGKTYLIRTVTMAWTGRLIHIGDRELVIEDAAWIADTGRFNECIGAGEINECEPVEGPVVIGRAAIIDACVWKHTLPRGVK